MLFVGMIIIFYIDQKDIDVIVNVGIHMIVLWTRFENSVVGL